MSAATSPNLVHQGISVSMGQLSPVVESEEGSSKQKILEDPPVAGDIISQEATPIRGHLQSGNWDDSFLGGHDQEDKLGLGSLSSASKQARCSCEEEYKFPEDGRIPFGKLFAETQCLQMSSWTLLQAIKETIQAQKLMSPEQVHGRKKGHALAILTETFDLVRAIFHRHKATAMNVELVCISCFCVNNGKRSQLNICWCSWMSRENTCSQVLDKMKLSQGGRKGPQDDTLRFNLHQLLEHSTPYLKLDQSGINGGQVLVVDHSTDLKEIREKIKLVSGGRGHCEADYKEELSDKQ